MPPPPEVSPFPAPCWWESPFLVSCLSGKKTCREEKRVPASLSDLHTMTQTHLFTRELHAKWPNSTTEESWPGIMKSRHLARDRNLGNLHQAGANKVHEEMIACLNLSWKESKSWVTLTQSHGTTQRRQCERFLLSHGSWTSAEDFWRSPSPRHLNRSEGLEVIGRAGVFKGELRENLLPDAGLGEKESGFIAT